MTSLYCERGPKNQDCFGYGYSPNVCLDLRWQLLSLSRNQIRNACYSVRFLLFFCPTIPLPIPSSRSWWWYRWEMRLPAAAQIMTSHGSTMASSHLRAQPWFQLLAWLESPLASWPFFRWATKKRTVTFREKKGLFNSDPCSWFIIIAT